MLGFHRDQCQQPQCLEIARIATQDFAVDRLSVFEASGAVMLRRLRNQFAGRIGAQERPHQFICLLCTTGLGQCLHQRQLRRLQFWIELQRPAQPLDGLFEPAEEQQAAAQFFVTLGVARLLFPSVPM